MLTAGFDIFGSLTPEATNAIGAFTICSATNLNVRSKKLTSDNKFTGSLISQYNVSENIKISRKLFFAPFPVSGKGEYSDPVDLCNSLGGVLKDTTLVSFNNGRQTSILHDSTSTLVAWSATSVNETVRYDYFKRIFDLLIAGSAILVLAPLFLGVIILLSFLDPGPVFFSQPRIGKGGRAFPCYKFRTMTKNADKILEHILANDPVSRSEWDSIQKLTVDPRITKFGRFLRISSIDELPQLFNVMRGDMSFIGPRPIVESERSRYGRYFSHYCIVKPGLTGLWQVSGRNLTTYRRRVALDTYYAKHV